VDCLGVLDRYAPRAAVFNKNTVELALFFHDAFMGVMAASQRVVGGVDAASGERASADFAGAIFTSVECPETARAVINCVLATQHFGDGLYIPSWETNITHDVDLHCLATPWAIFKANTRYIRQEYLQYSDEEFCAGRLRFYKDMASRPRLYLSAEFAPLEQVARVNLQKAIQEMESLDER